MSTGLHSGEKVTLHLQGVNLDDDRWENPASKFHTWRDGVWELLSGTEVLPRYSGGRVTSWNIPGGQGERRSALMPLAARLIPIRVKFYPICADPQDPRYQQWGRDPQERALFLRQNISEFMRRVQVGRQMVDGNLRLDRTVGGSGKQSCAVYFESDWDQQDAPIFAHSTLTIVARNPAGTWFGDWEYVDVGLLEPGRTTAVNVPMGDAPVEDARVAVRPAQEPARDGANWYRFTNLGGVGFQATMLSPWARWWIFRTLENRAGRPTDNTTRDWDIDTPYEQHMYSYGRRQGTALLITPGVPNDGRSVGRVNVRVGSPAYVMIAVRPKYF